VEARATISPKSAGPRNYWRDGGRRQAFGILPDLSPFFHPEMSIEADFWSAGSESFPPPSRWRAGCAIVFQQHDRRLIADRTVRSLLVVVSTPSQVMQEK
jgi:hypothetical protein